MDEKVLKLPSFEKRQQNKNNGKKFNTFLALFLKF
jgi:hypothetical protein